MAAPDNSLNLTTFNTTLNAYFRECDQDIRSEMNIAFMEPGGLHSLVDRFTVLEMVEDEMVLPNVTVSDFIRNKRVGSSSSTFNPTVDAVEMGSRTLKVRKYEGDLQFVDDELEVTFAMYLTEMKRLARLGSENRVISFVDYLFAKNIIAKAQETKHKAIYQAVYADTTPYSWNKILNGVEKVITDEVTAGNITPISMTSPTVTNIETLVESVFYDLGEAERHAPDIIVELSPAMHQLWKTRNSSSLGRQSTFDSKNADTIYGYPNAKVVLAPFLTGNKVLATAKSNKFIGVKEDATKPWEAQRHERLTKIMFNGKIGFEFARVNNVTGNQNVAYGA